MNSTLREHREKTLRETLSTVSQRSGISISHISAVERGLNLNSRRVPDFAKAYKLSIEEFERLVGANAGGRDGGKERQQKVRNTRRVPAGSSATSAT